MTYNKRFTRHLSFVVDNTADSKDRLMTIREVIPMMNELNDENEKLKSEIAKQSKQCTEGIQKVKEENEELKHSILAIIDKKIEEVKEQKYKAINQQDVSAVLCFEAMIELLKDLRKDVLEGL